MVGLEERIQARGLELFQAIQGKKPSIFDARTLSGALMRWSMRDEELKTQLFRLVDVLPALESSREVSEHIREYLASGNSHLPGWLRLAAGVSSSIPPLAAFGARRMVREIAKQFIVAETLEEAPRGLKQLRDRRLTFTADLLGETVVSEREADQFQAAYKKLIQVCSGAARTWPEIPQIDRGSQGVIPKVNVSIKISAFSSQIKAVDPAGSVAALARRVRPILEFAIEQGAFINFDMESTSLKEITLDLFKQLLLEPSLRDYRHFGVALQGYLRSSEQDLRSLLQWVEKRGCPITIRLIKGAYWDYERAVALQRSWPVPVFEQKQETDANFEHLAQVMLEHRNLIECAFGTHNLRSIAAVIGAAEEMNVSQSGYEFQMLYGMAEPIKSALVAQGYRVREYAPVGQVLPGMSYLVRRLLENSSNESFLRATFTAEIQPERLLENPAKAVTAPTSNNRPGRFKNEAPTDWTIPVNRERMSSALSRVRHQLGHTHSLIINGKALSGCEQFVSRNPARPTEIIGRVEFADVEAVDQAVGMARERFATWSRTAVDVRAALLMRLAEIIQKERFEIAALEVFETGKNWIESDADVAEAVDFCRFYASAMHQLGKREVNLLGEANELRYEGRGVAAIIAPWNFPLAILCGMTSAALVTGNCVLIKPAEQSSVVAAKFAELLGKAGFPKGTYAFLPGRGESVGKRLVEHPDISLTAFTGSKEVGLGIYEAAGRRLPGQSDLKKVICEMGGKNAIIVDSDADLDEAIPSLLYSAFGYAGQKCSALSRLIVVGKQYETLLHRLCEGARAMQIGLPEDPATVVGPVISEEAYLRIRNDILIGKGEAEVAFEAPIPSGLSGYFVGPTIFRDVPPAATIAREEIFGPVLCVLPAGSFEEGLNIANESEFALTGGIFSRNPRHIQLARERFSVGNLYINRAITGALVGRQPFGGFRMSGGGTKAGDTDYLLNFMYPRVITENTMRRGFAPPSTTLCE